MKDTPFARGSAANVGDNGGVKLFGLALVSMPLACAFVRPNPSTLQAFERYIELTETRLNQGLHPDRFLYLDVQPQLKPTVRQGEILIESRITFDKGVPIEAPDGQIQDWLGMMFMPGATIPKVRAVLQDYDHYKEIYKPAVVDSKLIKRGGNEFDIFLRLYKKQILTVVLNTEYHVKYGMTDPGHMYIISHSTRIAELKNAKHSLTEENPVEDESGFLWRLNSYWRFEEADGGVYAQCESISLSRDVPLGLGWMIGSFLEHFPRDSMMQTLRSTRKAVESLR